MEHSAEERVREEREEILSSFPRLPRCLLMLKWETNPTIHVLAHFMIFDIYFFLLDKHKGTIYKDTDIQKIVEIFYVD